MTALVIIFSLFAALCNASSAVLQRRASDNVSARQLFKGSFVLQVSQNRLWLTGLGLQVLAFLAQAAALKNGSLVIVEPLLTADLVFLMLMLRYRFHVQAGPREWGAVLAICAGLSGLLVAAAPRSGNVTFDLVGWITTSAIVGALLGAAIVTVRRAKSLTFRASIAGVAAGASFALTAAFTKLAVAQIGHGFTTFITTWEVYALIVSGAVSIIMMQSAYSAGPLAASQPAVEVTEPAVSTAIGIVLFGDIVNHSVTALVIESACALLLAWGVIALGGSSKIHRAAKKGL